MSTIDSQNPINKLPEQIKASFNAKIDSLSLFMIKKLGQVIPLIIMVFIVAFIFFFFTLFLSNAFIAWYADYIGKESTAAIIVAAFYLLLGVILLVFRKAIFYKPIHKMFAEGFDIKEVHPESNIGDISNINYLEKELEKSKTTGKIADNDLNNSIENIKDFYSFDTIKSRFIINILENPRLMIATAMQAFMSFQGYKSKKKDRKK